MFKFIKNLFNLHKNDFFCNECRDWTISELPQNKNKSIVRCKYCGKIIYPIYSDAEINKFKDKKYLKSIREKQSIDGGLGILEGLMNKKK